MINITDKTKCCGCWACEQVCPENCITMQEDNEGFLYPIVDMSLCIDCGLCEKVCPVINQYKPFVSEPPSFACVNNNEEIRMSSSSGGVFTLIAENVIYDKGVVFGARFEKDWSVVHDYTETIEGLKKFRGSKYVESKIGDNYIKAREFLKQGRKVLFSGTPCQIAGLNHFLRKKYENLIAMDIVCHSIPSSKIWKMYLDELSQLKGVVDKTRLSFKDITFRSKQNGWREYSIKVKGVIGEELKNSSILLSESKSKNSYMRGFLQDLFVRPSCSNCPARNYTSGSDIQLADFWGVEKYYPDTPILNDNKGVSLALIISDKGHEIFNKISDNIYSFQIKYDEVEDKGLHAPLTKSTPAHKNRIKFYKRLEKMSVSKNIESCLRGEEKKKAFVLDTKKAIKAFAGQKIYNTLKKLK